MRDSVLEVWLRLLALHVEDPINPGTQVSAIRDQWLLASRGYFNGCVPHGLSDVAKTPEGIALIRSATLSLMKALSQTAPAISKDAMNLMGMYPLTSDLETWRLLEVGQAFLDLCDGKIVGDATSTAFMPGCGVRPVVAMGDQPPGASGRC